MQRHEYAFQIKAIWRSRWRVSAAAGDRACGVPAAAVHGLQGRWRVRCSVQPKSNLPATMGLVTVLHRQRLRGATTPFSPKCGVVATLSCTRGTVTAAAAMEPNPIRPAYWKGHSGTF
jgi:hypothetical protein